MEKLQLSLFDIFTHILPGSFFVLSFIIINDDFEHLLDYIFNIAENLNFFNASIIIVVSYIFGFVNIHVSNRVFRFINFYFLGRKKKKKIIFSQYHNEIILIRHFSPKNFQALNKWFTMRAMSYALFFALLFFDISLFIKTIFNNTWSTQRIFILVLTLVISLLFLRRSISFHDLAYNTIKFSSKNLAKFQEKKEHNEF